MIQIIQDFIPERSKNRPMRPNPMKYITIHNTGNYTRGADAKAHATYIKSDEASNLPVSWHYTVDEKGAYQHLPDNETAYHAGDGNGAGNTQSIGIEICNNNDGNLLIATDNTTWLVADLCRKYNIPIQNVVQHNRWSGKDCPELLRRNRPYSWDIFIAKIEERLNSPISPEAITVENAISAGLVTDYTHWLGVLTGTITPNPKFIKILIDRAVEKLS